MSGRPRFAAAPEGSVPPNAASPMVVYDDAVARSFEPFALTRPVGTLESGTAAIYKRWQTALQMPCSGIIAAEHLADFDEAPGTVGGVLPAGTIVANARFAASVEIIPMRGKPTDSAQQGEYVSKDSRAGVWTNGNRVAAVRLRKAMPVAEFAGGRVSLESLAGGMSHAAPIDGWWHDEVWDFIRHLPAVTTDDINRLRSHQLLLGDDPGAWAVPDHVTVIGNHAIILWGQGPGAHNAPPAVVEAHVVLDASAGPILIEPGAHIQAFTRIIGPCRIGANTTVVGGDIRACSIGPMCKIRGEMSNSIVLGYSNKGHEGFIGHSYLGRWVNVGAGTTTSNLKNTYGPVSLWTPAGIRETGMQFLGTMFGDHVKTGIGTLLTTGTVLSAGANVFGSHMPPKVVPPFAWGEGEPYDTYRLDKFLSSAALMMERRHVTLTDRAKRQLSASFERRAIGNSKAVDHKPGVVAAGRRGKPKVKRKPR